MEVLASGVHTCLGFGISVLVVAEDGATNRRKMSPQLVSSASQRTEHEPGILLIVRLDCLVLRPGILQVPRFPRSLRVGAHARVAGTVRCLPERKVDHARGRHGHAAYDRHICLLDIAFAERARQFGGSAARATENEETGRRLVDPVDKPKRLAVTRKEVRQRGIDMTSLAAAPLNREARRLVDRDDMFVLVDDRAPQVFQQLRINRRARRLRRDNGRRQGRHTNHLTLRDPVRSLHPRTVEADLTLPQPFLQHRLRHLRKPLPEPAIEASVALARSHGHLLHTGHACPPRTSVKASHTATSDNSTEPAT